MKSKRLLILIAVVACILVLMICLSAIFSVKDAWVEYYNFDGSKILAPEGAPTIDDVLHITQGKNIVFLSKSQTLEQLQCDGWHAIGLVKSFPNQITVHFIQRSLAVKIVSGGQDIYIDSKGYVMAQPEDTTCVDITSAFGSVLDIATNEQNKPLTFTTEKSNQKFQQILQAVLTVWYCNIDMNNIPAVLGASDVFTYDGENMVITMQSGAKIVVNSPGYNLQERLFDAFSVYYNANENLQQSGVVITVREDGKITKGK